MKPHKVAEPSSHQALAIKGKSATQTDVPAPERRQITVSVSFYSYFKELTGCDKSVQHLVEGSTLGDLFDALMQEFPKLVPMRKSTLMAVGLNYQDRGYVLQDDDEISLFPPVQGG